MGGGGLGYGSSLAGGTRLNIAGAGDMSAPEANGMPAIAAGDGDEKGDRGNMDMVILRYPGGVVCEEGGGGSLTVPSG